MSRLGLREPALASSQLLLDVGPRPPYLVIGPLEQLGERELDVGADPTNLGHAILAHLFQKRGKCTVVQPTRRLREKSHCGHVRRRISRREVAKQARLLEA